MTDRLNPEALEAASDAVTEIYADGYCPKAEDAAEVAVSAYLAALPAPRTITTVEELDVLPYGSLVRANNGNEFYKAPVFDYPWSQGREHDRYASGYLAKLAPITVIHAPTEGGGE